MLVKKCEYCGKVFFARSERRMYCSAECKHNMAVDRREEYGQLCWRCAKACGGCAWSDSDLPVFGWDAEPTIVKDSQGDYTSYRIKKCPEFIYG